jgi:hypothetical protein
MTKRPAYSQNDEVLRGTRAGKNYRENEMMNTYSTEHDRNHTAQATSLPDASIFDEWVDVRIHIEAELSLVQFCQQGVQKMFYSEDIDAVQKAALDSDGTAQWCEKYAKLLIPSTRSGAGNRFFSLVRMEMDPADR